MDACVMCPFADLCRSDPDAPCFLDSTDNADYWDQIGAAHG